MPESEQSRPRRTPSPVRPDNARRPARDRPASGRARPAARQLRRWLFRRWALVWVRSAEADRSGRTIFRREFLGRRTAALPRIFAGGSRPGGSGSFGGGGSFGAVPPGAVSAEDPSEAELAPAGAVPFREREFVRTQRLVWIVGNWAIDQHRAQLLFPAAAQHRQVLL